MNRFIHSFVHSFIKSNTFQCIRSNACPKPKPYPDKNKYIYIYIYKDPFIDPLDSLLQNVIHVVLFGTLLCGVALEKFAADDLREFGYPKTAETIGPILLLLNAVLVIGNTPMFTIITIIITIVV